MLASHLGTGLSLGCSTSAHVVGKAAAEEGLCAWIPAPIGETWKKLLGSALSSAGYGSHLGNE